MSKKISIIGGRGFTGQELIKLIESHPEFELAQAFSSSVAGEEIMIDEHKLKKTYASLNENTEFVEEDAFILALTALLKSKGQCESRPKGFPKEESWIDHPKRDIIW